VSFTATNLCVASHQVFIVVCVTCNSIFSNEEQCNCIKICFMLEKTALKMHSMLKISLQCQCHGEHSGGCEVL
jgi:hypothetical protein